MKESEGMRRLVFAVPESVAAATEVAAQRDLTSLSYICRRALVNELRERGLLPDDKSVLIAYEEIKTNRAPLAGDAR
jgi:hypothetical protein